LSGFAAVPPGQWDFNVHALDLHHPRLLQHWGSSLIYEILWTRMIVKIIGGAPFAVSIILSIFMGGLGLGSYIAGRFIDRIKEPLALVKIYGMLELAIGAYAIGIPLLLTALRMLQAILYNGLYNHFIIYNLLTFIVCAVILSIPVICMGATLPILCRFYVASVSHLGTHAGRLYGLNTIGAALGSLLCGFWLIDLWGVSGTLAFAVLVTALIGISCLTVGYKVKGMNPDTGQKRPGSKKTPPKDEAPSHPSERRAALVIFFVSGFCAMACEVIWTRLLGLIVGPTTYSFTIVLVTFITGLALGSIIFGYLADKVKRCIGLLLFTQVAAALLVLAVSQVLGSSQVFFAKLIFTFKDQFALLSLLIRGIITSLQTPRRIL
jgi:spermidine synthase